jgi:hypothetical protein
MWQDVRNYISSNCKNGSRTLIPICTISTTCQLFTFYSMYIVTSHTAASVEKATRVIFEPPLLSALVVLRILQ